MKIKFLGTGAGLPSKERNVSAVALDLLQERGSIWLFDCGEGTQHQVLHTTIRPRRIEKIFITHMHGDHLYGLPGLLSSRSFQDGETPVTLYGPKGLEEYVQMCLKLSGTNLAYPIYYKTVEEGVIFEDEQFKIHCIELDHGIISFGYRIEEKDLPGQLLVDKLKKQGIKPGPIYNQIKTNEITTLENGTVIKRSDYVGEKKPGRIISFLGDTRYFNGLSNFVMNSDVLVCEATFQAEDHQLAKSYYHTTTEQAAHLALISQVKQLLLTHISSRYQGKDQHQQLESEAQRLFPNSQLASDLSEFIIPNKSLSL